MQDFRRLDVWNAAHRLVLATYAETGAFPASERYRLADQLRRATAAIATNIAESCGTRSDAERARFLSIAFASASEAEYEFLLAHDLGYVQPGAYAELSHETQRCKRMLAALLAYLRRKRQPAK